MFELSCLNLPSVGGGGGGGGLVRGDVPAVLFAGEGELVELFADVFALLGGDLGGLVDRSIYAHGTKYGDHTAGKEVIFFPRSSNRRTSSFSSRELSASESYCTKRSLICVKCSSAIGMRFRISWTIQAVSITVVTFCKKTYP